MTAQEYLRQYEDAKDRVEQYEMEYRDELSMLDSIRSSSDNDGMPHGSNISKPTEDKAVKLAEVHLRLIEARLEALAIRQEIFDFIDGIGGIEGNVLYERYIMLHTWEVICETLHYSWSGIHNVHRRALKIAEEKMRNF